MKLLKFIVIFAFCVCYLSGCKTTGGVIESEYDPVTAGLGTVVFYLESQSLWQQHTSVGAALIMVDEKEIGTLRFDKKAVINLKPGNRKISIYFNDMYPIIPLVPKLAKDWEGEISIKEEQRQEYSITYKSAQIRGRTQISENLEMVRYSNSQIKILRSDGDKKKIPIGFTHSEK
jgi:hypothetical protein